MTPRNTLWAHRLMISDLSRTPDWQTALTRATRRQSPDLSVGFILRDYDHPQRSALASAMAQHCRRLGIAFFIGGDWRLAQKLGARFHAREKQIAMTPCFSQCGQALAAAHHSTAIHKAARAGFGGVLISPVFATPSHPQSRPLGVCRFTALARLAYELGLKAYALGGMDERRFHRLAGAHRFCAGFAAIRHFTL